MTLALVGTILVTTKAWNPLPQLAEWWDKITVLSQPEPTWTGRLSGVSDRAAVMAAGQVVVASRGFVEAFESSRGDRLWTYPVHWALPAWDVVVMRSRPANPDADREPDRGYSVVDPLTGTVLWGDREAAAVWVFSEHILDLTCTDGDNCQLRARRHRDNGNVLWTVPLPAAARTIHGAQPALTGTRDPAEWFAEAAAGTPRPLPPVIGLAVDGRIQMINTFEGVRIREVTPPDRETRVAFSGERLLFAHAERADSGCRYWVEAFGYRSHEPAWRLDGLDLDTASGAGCEQRRDPLGTANRLVGIRSDNHPALISAVDGEPVWSGLPGERILATDGELAVVVGADRKTVRVLDLLDAEQRPVWTATMGQDPEAAVTTAHVIIWDGDVGRVVVLDHVGAGLLRDIKTKASIIGHGTLGLILASGRRIGFISLR
jgi:hypothetical protein